MPRPTWIISVVLLLITAIRADAQDGLLQRVRDNANAPSTSDNNKKKSADTSSDSGCSDESSFTSSLSAVLVLAPFLLPIELLDDSYKRPLPFTPHPYFEGYHGYQIMEPEWAKSCYNVDTSEVTRKNWAVRLSAENGNDFAGINRVGGQLKIEGESRFGVLTTWNFFRENLGDGRSDQTTIGDANVTFRFAQNEMASMYAGLGVRILTDRQQTDAGINFIYGGDWFPVRPMVVSSQIDAGNLRNAGVFHARATVGAIWQGVEVFAGYDFLRIGDVNLQGPLAGVRFWF